jgi:DNA-binding NarL/FixJ family response regulator
MSIDMPRGYSHRPSGSVLFTSVQPRAFRFAGRLTAGRGKVGGERSRRGRRLRALVADDVATRAGIRIALDRGGIDVCGEAGNAESAVEAALDESPDVCLVDAGLPGGGMAAVATIAAEAPETAVVVLAASEDPDQMLDALRAGASGYLPKDIDPRRLPQTLEAVHRGEAAIPRRLVVHLVEEFRERRRHRIALPDRAGIDLTSREWEVLELLREGLSTAAIAERLFITAGTVRTHLAAVLRKLDVPDRQAAVNLLETR